MQIYDYDYPAARKKGEKTFLQRKTFKADLNRNRIKTKLKANV